MCKRQLIASRCDKAASEIRIKREAKALHLRELGELKHKMIQVC